MAILGKTTMTEGTVAGDFTVDGKTVAKGNLACGHILGNDGNSRICTSAPVLSLGDGLDRGLIFEGEANGGKVYNYDVDTGMVISSDSLYLVGSLSDDLVLDDENNGVNHRNTIVWVTGKVNASQGFFQTSDARKKDVRGELDIEKCYEMLDKCQEVLYTLKNDDKEQIGMIAQEVEEFFPEIISTDKEGYKSIDYSKLTVICLRILKDLVKKIEKISI